ncbi:zinc finger protein 862-like [Diadema setosum]|uniref:zinc finger protein 862-like n=1 Tax=Diadema setosum TaxID=31175 RepID=UPI003B3B6005
MVVTRVAEAGMYGVLVDDTTDIAVIEQMVTFVSYVNQETASTQVDFLSVTNVLEDPDSEGANAKVLFTKLMKELDKCDLDVADFMGLVTDGAAVMTGATGGLAALIKQENKEMISVHCICHRLSLACTRSTDETNYLPVVETILRQLWKFYENSPKRTAQFMKTQLEYKAAVTPTLMGEAKKLVVRKIRKACRTRWLSLDHSVQGVFHDFAPLLLSLNHFAEKDAVATGLLKKMKTAKFLGAIHILKEVLPILSTLSKIFQYGTVNYARIGPALSAAKAALREVLDSGRVLADMRKDLAEDGRLSTCELHPTEHQYNEVSSMLQKYVSALEENLDHRFKEALPVLQSFSIFDPMSCSEDLSYGRAEIKILGKHFFPDCTDSRRKLDAEWCNFKYEMLQWQNRTELRTAKSPTEWVLGRIMKMKQTYAHVYPKLFYIAQVCATLPVSNAWPERGVSAMKRIKTRLRSRLGNDMLEALMHISINGPATDSPEAADIIKKAVRRWKTQGPKRRRLPNPKKRCASPTPLMVTVDAQVQTDDPNDSMADDCEALVVETQADIHLGQAESVQGGNSRDQLDIAEQVNSTTVPRKGAKPKERADVPTAAGNVVQCRACMQCTTQCNVYYSSPAPVTCQRTVRKLLAGVPGMKLAAITNPA